MKALPAPARSAAIGFALLVAAVYFGGCASVSRPEGVTPVSGFELSRYLGRWYEIARLDHSFERNMVAVTADYSLREDGGVKVLNRGYNTATSQWKDAVGRAYFVKDPQTGFLKVSFFGPFYGSYIIFELDKENYEYAFVSGPDKSYLWLLARAPEVPAEVLEHFLLRSRELGFDTDALIYPNHGKESPGDRP